MKTILHTLLFMAIGIPVFSQTVSLTQIATLPTTIEETSGLLFLDGKLITHNDSQNEAYLYEIDTLTGNVSRKVFVKNATNVDWEDICADDTYIYIADVGNNNGTRTNLKIYRVLISEYHTTPNDTISAESISYSYVNQTDFTSNANTNFDAEAIIAYNDSIYIFTKNWGDMRCNVYSLPKTPGNYTSKRVDSFDPQGMITGADYNAATQKIMLSGYTLFGAFLVQITQFSGNLFSNGLIHKQSLNTSGSYQTESIAFFKDNSAYISSEKSIFGSAWLGRLSWQENTNVATELVNEKINISPNPANHLLYIDRKESFNTTFYNLKGQIVLSSDQNPIDISKLNQGWHILYFSDNKGQIIAKQRLLVK